VKEFHREFDTNVLGTILAIQEALKLRCLMPRPRRFRSEPV
jgi:hypothetical protein